MKPKIFIIVCGIFLMTGILPAPVQQTASAQVTVSFQAFYDQLSPFGSWVNYPGNGYVWVPNAGSSFRPYGSRGHWVYTEDGWAWVSDYSWGWAPFHYGNWFYDNSYGWMWAPGYNWAPAWVTWGEYGGNYCWAPIGLQVNIGVAYGTYRPPYNYWNFCPRNRITSVNVSNYYVTNIRNSTTINKITVINNVNRGGNAAYLKGPTGASVEKYTHSPVRPMAIQASSRPGASTVQRGQLAIYRPAVQSNNAAARPARIQNLSAIRPVNRGGATTNRAGNPVVNRPVNPSVNRPGNTTVNHSSGTPANRPVNTTNNRPAPVTPRPTPASRPATSPVNRQQPAPQHTVQPRPVQPRPAPQPRPVPQQHPVQQQRSVQPRPAPQVRPAPQPRPAPVPEPRPVQREGEKG
jgi:uncharacterized protein DUF6600